VGNRPQGESDAPRAFVGLGIEMAVTIVIFMYAGYRLDIWLETRPWLFTAASLVGIAAAFFNFFRRVMPGGGPDDGKA